jgi:hypothetical protein
MTTFDDRERGYEGKFVLDQETAFRVHARRNRMLGEWAGAKLGKSGDELAAYAREVVKADFEEPGDEDVYRRLATDLAGVADEAEIRAKMLSTLAEAQASVQAG